MSKNNQLTQEELQRIRQLDFTQIDGYVDASELLAKQVGEKSTVIVGRYSCGEKTLKQG